MTVTRSRITAQGQISVPAGVRRQLGVGPGSVLEWEDKDEQIVVRRAGRYSSAEIHVALFPDATPKHKSAAAMREGIRAHIRRRHARH